MCNSCQSKIRLDTQKKLCCAHAEGFHILHKTLILSIWMKQLPLYAIGGKTQIDLIFWNIIKTTSLSCYIIAIIKILELLNKKPIYLIKTFLKLHNHLNKLLHRIERTKLTYSLMWKYATDRFTACNNDPLKT